MNNIISDLINYFKTLASQHKDVQGFKTGEIYESNHNNIDYPVIWVRFPMNGTIGNQTNDDWILMDVNLACYTNLAYDEWGNEIIASESTTIISNNQIEDEINPLADQQISKAIDILGQFASKIRSDADDWILKATIESCTFATKARVFNDDVNGAEMTIRMRISNPYRCDLNDIFIINNNFI